ncbi:hypothetical protein TNCT_321651 [Trichonephila clavata]|uniref:Uncharacterized protein n=1 Tax=Trichonephila clavata TaxID=2740835 RepID=A0A8X6K7A6_TRICU|nr:hypothetical protein TNCT_321651 [Trichonephila clavata]
MAPGPIDRQDIGSPGQNDFSCPVGVYSRPLHLRGNILWGPETCPIIPSIYEWLFSFPQIPCLKHTLTGMPKDGIGENTRDLWLLIEFI